MRVLVKPALLWAFFVLPIGCASGAREDAGADPAVSSLGLLSLERSVDGDADAARLSASAKVARFRGIDGEGLLKVLGAEPRELETCGAAAALDDGALSAAAQVDLLSVGSIAVRLGGTEHSLSPRLFPALATTAAGWFYAGAAELPGALEDEPFQLSAAGQAGLGKFEIRGTTPPEVRGLSLGGELVSAGSVLSRAANAELTWEPSALSGDRIELEIFSAGSTLSCAARDDGHFRIPNGQLRVLEADESAALIVRRVRTVPIEMSGVESAYVRIAVTRSVSLHVE